MIKIPEHTTPSIILSAIRERVLFTEFSKHVTDFEITHVSKVEGRESWDVIIQSGTSRTNFLIEIKVRDKKMEWDNWILEEYKYNKLTGLTNTIKSEQMGTKTLYMNIYQNGAIIWNINKEDRPSFFKRDSITSTIEDRGRKDKMVAYLKNKDGIIYNYKNDIKKATEKSKVIFEFMWPGIPVPNEGIWKIN